MKRTTTTITVIMALFLFFALWGFGSSAAGGGKQVPRSSTTKRQGPQPDDEKFQALDNEPAQERNEERGDDPDRPSFAKGRIDEGEYVRLRDEYNARLRGWDPEKPPDRTARTRAIEQMEAQEAMRTNGLFGSLSSLSELASVSLAPWVELGPNPIPNGQTVGVTTPVSGRVTVIKVSPTDPNLVFVGTAQGGLYRSTDGGTTWTPLMDGALTLAIGAIAIAPSQPGTIYVGTGEPNFALDCFFGVGLYRIDNAGSATPTISGPFNRDGSNADVFTGRSIGGIQVHPTDPNTIFVSTTSGIGGIGGNSSILVPSRGVYRSTNATTASPTFTKLTGLAANANASVRDIIIDPLNPDLLVANVVAAGAVGGLYTSSNALSASPTFTQTAVFNSSSTSELTANFAIHHTNAGNPPTIYAATGNLGGRVLRSLDNGATWTQQIDNDFCTAQCFYDIAIDVDPTNADHVFLGGSPNVPFAFSINGGTSFTTSQTGLHVDSHAIAVAPSQPTTIYFGSDGGVWKSTTSGAAWTSMNNGTLRATQFESIAVHPTDPDFSIGGTQDNGTEKLTTGPTWIRSEGGDGGYALIDQNATNTTTVTMYHTFFNQAGTQIGNSRSLNAGTNWSFIGCSGSATQNGISCTDTVNFYCPTALGPGIPNTVYVGTDRLYRSSTSGTANVVVSQAPLFAGSPLSSIGISPQDDNYRVVGLNNGLLFYTATGSSSLLDLDPSNQIPNFYVSRIMFDPKNKNTVYIALGNYAGGTSPTQSHVWRIDNLGTAPVITSVNGTGASTLPDVPTNGLAVDPTSPNNIYAGTDIGVYGSVDSGAHWSPYGTGLPRVAVFDMAISKVKHVLRIATHGRGMWEVPFPVMSFSSASYTVAENGGSATINVNRTGDASGTSTVDYKTSDGTASQSTDYTITSGTLTFNPGDTIKSFTVPIVDDVLAESNETFTVTLTSTAGATLSAANTATVTINDNDGGGPSIPQKRFFAAMDGTKETPPNGSAGVGGGLVKLDAGDTAALVGLSFTGLGSAESAAHIHTGAAGVAGPITFGLPTTNPVIDQAWNSGNGLTAQNVIDLKAGNLYVNVHSGNFPNGEIRGQLLWNPILEDAFMVRQHYLDFLNREPDAGGLNFWIGEIHCPQGLITDQADVQCYQQRTIGVSDSFFFSPEFHQTAAYVFLAYRAAFGNTQPFPVVDPANQPEANKLPEYGGFMTDRARVLGGAGLTAQQQAFANQFVTRPEFLNKYPTATYPTPASFVGALIANILAADGVNLSSQQAALETQYNNAGGGNAGRAQVLYCLSLDDVANNPIGNGNQSFVNAEYNRQFALTLYYGYLRRNPDINGFLFWQGQINLAPVGDGDKQRALVCSFLTSSEYAFRFGPNAPRFNRECP